MMSQAGSQRSDLNETVSPRKTSSHKREQSHFEGQFLWAYIHAAQKAGETGAPK